MAHCLDLTHHFHPRKLYFRKRKFLIQHRKHVLNDQFYLSEIEIMIENDSVLAKINRIRRGFFEFGHKRKRRILMFINFYVYKFLCIYSKFTYFSKKINLYTFLKTFSNAFMPFDFFLWENPAIFLALLVLKKKIFFSKYS